MRDTSGGWHDGRVRSCTLFEVTDGTPGRILDISFVEDDHQFGLSEDGTRLHVGGEVTSVTPESSFACPRCGMTSYNPNDVREGYCGNCHDWTGGSGGDRP